MADVELEEPCDFYYLNLFGLAYEVDEQMIRDHYKNIHITKVIFGKGERDRGLANIEFEKKDDLIAAIDRGNCSFFGKYFNIRSSMLWIYARFYEPKEKGAGKKKLQEQT